MPPNPTNHFGLVPHWRRNCNMPPKLAARAARRDALIAAFAFGVMLGLFAGASI